MKMTSRNDNHQSPTGTLHRWDFLTNHAHVLVCVAHDPGIRLRDIADVVGITERTAHQILSELVEEGYVGRERHGRRNRYTVKPELPLPHPLVQDRQVGELIEVLKPARHDSVTAHAKTGTRVGSERPYGVGRPSRDGVTRRN